MNRASTASKESVSRALASKTRPDVSKTQPRCVSSTLDLNSKLSDSDSEDGIPASKLHGRFIVKGQELHPTIAFDRLFYWIAERHEIWGKRSIGLCAPWTNDEVLAKNRFCNPYRFLDRTCQYLIANVIQRGPQDFDEVIFRIVLFSYFMRIETWELLEFHLVDLIWAEFSAEEYIEVLTDAKENHRNLKLYTGAFQIPCRPGGGQQTHEWHMHQLIKIMGSLPSVIRNATFVVDVFEWLIKNVEGMADFRAYQLILNLSYSHVLPFNPNDMVVTGPGAEAGLQRMFGKSYQEAKEIAPFISWDIVRWLVDHQDELFAKFQPQFTWLRDENGQRVKLKLEDMEHSICELDKFARADPILMKYPIRNARIKQAFNPLEKTAEVVKWLKPKAWDDARRQVLRIGCSPVDGNDVYYFERIIKHWDKNTKSKGGGTRAYLLAWLYWDEKDATWLDEKEVEKGREEGEEVICRAVDAYERRMAREGKGRRRPSEMNEGPARKKTRTR